MGPVCLLVSSSVQNHPTSIQREKCDGGQECTRRHSGFCHYSYKTERKPTRSHSPEAELNCDQEIQTQAAFLRGSHRTRSGEKTKPSVF